MSIDTEQQPFTSKALPKKKSYDAIGSKTVSQPSGTLMVQELPQGFSCPPLVSNNIYLRDDESNELRHEQVAIALYLPNDTSFQMHSSIISKNEHNYCIRNKHCPYKPVRKRFHITQRRNFDYE